MVALVACAVLVPVAARAEPVIAGDLAGLAWDSYGGGAGVGAYAGVGFRFGDAAWIEPHGTIRAAYFPRGVSSNRMIDPMLGFRAGFTVGKVRPWVGGFVGAANHYHVGGDGDGKPYDGTAFDGAVGCELVRDEHLSWTLRFDVNHDDTDPSYGTRTWFGLGAGAAYTF
jgi:hypothetical protein